MDENSYREYRQNLVAKLDEYYQSADLFRVIELLENSELDFDLCMELTRTYINVANQSGDPYSLYQKATLLLDKNATAGRDDPRWLFYKGYILFRQGLITDALSRFERALSFASVEHGQLFSNLVLMTQKSRDEISLGSFKSLDDENKALLDSHIEKNFGAFEKLCSFSNVDVYTIAANEKHDYSLLVTSGLSSKALAAEEGLTEHLEICLALPKDYRFDRDPEGSFEVFMFIEIAKHLICSSDYTGFGYFIKRDASFSKRTAFTGAMLCALGDYSTAAQSFKNAKGEDVIFYELLPLRPMEVAYRESHSAYELLDLFKEKLIRLTPFISTRDDAAMNLYSSQKRNSDVI